MVFLFSNRKAVVDLVTWSPAFTTCAKFRFVGRWQAAVTAYSGINKI